MNKTCHVLRHCCVGKKWWDRNKPMTKRSWQAKNPRKEILPWVKRTISNKHDTIN